jgi:putative ABC transport system permease protein
LARIQSIKGEPITETNENTEEAFDREQFFRTREYTLTRRSVLSEGEELVRGKSLFGPQTKGITRVSLEVEFAKRIQLSVGDKFVLSIGGIPVETRVDSLRKVKWNNFRPNFFIVVNEEDLKDAPMDYVGVARVEDTKISDMQKKISSDYPEVSVLDGEAISQRLVRLLNQLSFAVQSVGLFALGSCVLVFVGILLSRRQTKMGELALLRTLGVRSRQIRALFLLEVLSLSLGALGLAFGLSYLANQAMSRFYLDIPVEALPSHSILGFYAGLLALLTVLGLCMFQGLLKQHPLAALRETDEA